MNIDSVIGSTSRQWGIVSLSLAAGGWGGEGGGGGEDDDAQLTPTPRIIGTPLGGHVYSVGLSFKGSLQ